MTGAELIPWILGAAAILAALAVIWKAVKRAGSATKNVRGDVVAVRDSILGRPAVVDTITGRELAPALPGIGVRQDRTEQQMEMLTEAVSKIADSHKRLEHVEIRQDEQAAQIAELKAAQMERVITRAESTQAWQTIEAAINATPADESESE